jgi:hypothetical protein
MAGFAPEVISQDWNLIPLCRPCHWLYDGREDIWVGHYLKQESIRNKGDQIIAVFIDHLNAAGITARLPSDAELQEIDVLLNGDFLDVDEVGIWYGSETTILMTKVGAVVVNAVGDWGGEDGEPIRIWRACLKKFHVKPSKEFRRLAEELEQQYIVKREKLLELLKPNLDEAIKRANELAQQHIRFYDLKVGEPWSEKSKITGFDVTHLKQDGMVRVLTWRLEP